MQQGLVSSRHDKGFHKGTEVMFPQIELKKTVFGVVLALAFLILHNMQFNLSAKFGKEPMNTYRFSLRKYLHLRQCFTSSRQIEILP